MAAAAAVFSQSVGTIHVWAVPTALAFVLGNLHQGCVDEPLTKKGIEEALQAGIRICNIPIDVIYTSTLIRAQMTAMLAMTQHRHKKKKLQECLYQRSAPISTNSRKIKEEERFTEWMDNASAVLISKACAFIKK
ncbi:hypothetical protein WN944_023653 [Citrus x changshan-huyou]|uniref:phosphoglycerate mutase (2,3-diphosphoglycerate-dependent) n=1 Tax=Citrus x changshan-huyou TaxID=2935761 RepID=A0AAP0N355_9ROSI